MAKKKPPFLSGLPQAPTMAGVAQASQTPQPQTGAQTKPQGLPQYPTFQLGNYSRDTSRRTFGTNQGASGPPSAAGAATSTNQLPQNPNGGAQTAPEMPEGYNWTDGLAEDDVDVTREGSGEEGPIDYQQRFDDLWGEIQGQHEAGLSGILEGTYADEANASRRANEMNALSGGGMGGAFAGGQAQVALGGMQQRQQARNEHLKQGLQMKMTVLQRYLDQAENEKDRDLQEWLQTEADKTAMELAQMGYQAQSEQNEAIAEGMDAQNANAGGTNYDSDWWFGENSAYGNTADAVTDSLPGF